MANWKFTFFSAGTSQMFFGAMCFQDFNKLMIAVYLFLALPVVNGSLSLKYGKKFLMAKAIYSSLQAVTFSSDLGSDLGKHLSGLILRLASTLNLCQAFFHKMDTLSGFFLSHLLWKLRLAAAREEKIVMDSLGSVDI